MSAHNYSLFTNKKQRQFKVTEDLNTLTVRMYNTDIVTFYKNTKKVYLNTDGYKTVTTKAAINNALKQLGSNLYVSQIKHVWYVHRGHDTKIKVEFKDNMDLSLN